ncbi:MAG: hypothetical protein L3J57_15625 [Desulfuromusa sp.]|nr:hypothetical protein [Desulfuromusa sp.]
MRFNAESILRHKPPFCFIGAFDFFDEGGAEADINPFDTLPAWIISPECSALPVEFAAQLMGACSRLERDREVKAGFLSKVKCFEWVSHPQKIVRIRVEAGFSLGEFYDFTAQFIGVIGDVCAKLSATLYLSDNPVHQEGGESLSAKPIIAKNSGSSVMSELFLVNDGNVTGGQMDFFLNPDCPVYDGHFPGNPITPGVLLVDAMTEAACRLKGNNCEDKLQLVRLRDVVFQSLVFPGDNLLVKVRETQSSAMGFQNFTASIFNSGKRCARAKITLRSI